MKRYQALMVDESMFDSGYLSEHPEGGWVRYADVSHLLPTPHGHYCGARHAACKAIYSAYKEESGFQGSTRLKAALKKAYDAGFAAAHASNGSSAAVLKAMAEVPIGWVHWLANAGGCWQVHEFRKLGVCELARREAKK